MYEGTRYFTVSSLWQQKRWANTCGSVILSLTCQSVTEIYFPLVGPCSTFDAWLGNQNCPVSELPVSPNDFMIKVFPTEWNSNKYQTMQCSIASVLVSSFLAAPSTSTVTVLGLFAASHYGHGFFSFGLDKVLQTTVVKASWIRLSQSLRFYFHCRGWFNT